MGSIIGFGCGSNTMTGMVVGYDPGGNGAHGFAVLRIRNDKPSGLETITLESAENIIRLIEHMTSIIALGVDTLTCLCTGVGGWRPADRWLREKCKQVRNSVVAPNSLFGSMGLNGMAVLVEAKRKFPGLVITETHPKVLCWQIFGHKYDYSGRKAVMDEALAGTLDLAVAFLVFVTGGRIGLFGVESGLYSDGIAVPLTDGMSLKPKCVSFVLVRGSA
jgi:hypothetical protein